MKNLENKTVIVPYDFSDFALEAVDVALGMAAESTRLHVIHVVEPIVPIIPIDPTMSIPPSYDKERYDQAQEQLQSTFGTEKYSRFQIHCEKGDPGTEIVNCARSLSADLIIIPSHGRRGLARLFLGSVAERVLQLAGCPVLVLRKPVE